MKPCYAALKAVADIIVESGEINVDFADIERVS